MTAPRGLAPPALAAAGVPAGVAAVLGDDGRALEAGALTHNPRNQTTGGIWRVRGLAGSAVLKLATAGRGGDPAWATSEHGHHWNHWRREPLAYTTGFAHRVYAGAGLGAPRLLAAVEPDPGTVALWLEDVQGLPGPRWAVADLAEALPQTTCHLDLWPMNLVARPGGELVLLDWSFAGAGAVGEDIGNLIPDSVADALMDPDLLPAIDDAVTTGYLAGLHAAGWQGRDALVRQAIAVTGAAKYCWLAPFMVQRLTEARRPLSYDRRTPPSRSSTAG